MVLRAMILHVLSNMTTKGIKFKIVKDFAVIVASHKFSELGIQISTEEIFVSLLILELGREF